MTNFKSFDLRVADDVTVIKLTRTSYLTDEEIAAFRDDMTQFLAEGPVGPLVIDFNDVRTFGSEAVGQVLAVARRLREAGGDVKLCSMGSVVREIFEICDLIPKMFQLHDSSADAVQSYAA